jgi:hypothetical protein
MKKNKKIKKEKLFKSGDVMSILENMSDGIQLIAEQHGEIVTRLGGIDVRLGGIDKRMDGMQGDINEIKERLARVEDNTIEIKHKLSEKVDLADFQKLEKRLVKLERLVLSMA